MNWFKAQSPRSAVGCTQSSVNSHEITFRFYFHPYDNRNDRFEIEIGPESDQHSVKFRDSHSFVISNPITDEPYNVRKSMHEKKLKDAGSDL